MPASCAASASMAFQVVTSPRITSRLLSSSRRLNASAISCLRVSSGHTASACNIFIFVVLFKGKRRYIANIIALLFVVLTMFSRIVVNAHFLSDVLIGGLVSYLCYYTIRKVFERKKSIISIADGSAGIEENLC